MALLCSLPGCQLPGETMRCCPRCSACFVLCRRHRYSTFQCPWPLFGRKPRMTEVPICQCDIVGCVPYVWWCEPMPYYPSYPPHPSWYAERPEPPPGLLHQNHACQDCSLAKKGIGNRKLPKPTATPCADVPASEPASEPASDVVVYV